MPVFREIAPEKFFENKRLIKDKMKKLQQDSIKKYKERRNTTSQSGRT